MNRRIELHNKLVELLGSNNVYYQPPDNLTMKYPAIRYKKEEIENKFADNSKYKKIRRYQLIIIDKLPDNDVIDRILDLPYSKHDNHYVSNNLNHDVISIYY